MLGFEIDYIQIIWVYQFICENYLEKIIKVIIEPQIDKIFVGIDDEKYTYLLNEMNVFLDKHCGNAVEKYIHLEDI